MRINGRFAKRSDSSDGAIIGELERSNGEPVANGPELVDTTSAAPTSGGNSGTGRKRGPYKPRASGGNGSDRSTESTGRKKKEVSLDLSTIEGLLFLVHSGLSSLTKNEDWLLDESETKSVATTVVNVARHYPSVAASQKVLDWGAMIYTVGMVYGSRIISQRNKMRERKQNASDENQSSGPLFNHAA